MPGTSSTRGCRVCGPVRASASARGRPPLRADSAPPRGACPAAGVWNRCRTGIRPGRRATMLDCQGLSSSPSTALSESTVTCWTGIRSCGGSPCKDGPSRRHLRRLCRDRSTMGRIVRLPRSARTGVAVTRVPEPRRPPGPGQSGAHFRACPDPPRRRPRLAPARTWAWLGRQFGCRQPNPRRGCRRPVRPTLTRGPARWPAGASVVLRARPVSQRRNAPLYKTWTNVVYTTWTNATKQRWNQSRARPVSQRRNTPRRRLIGRRSLAVSR